jgi:hypothetical protein
MQNIFKSFSLKENNIYKVFLLMVFSNLIAKL